MALESTEAIFCALDTTDVAKAEALARDLSGYVGGIKLGLEFFGSHGPAGAERLAATGLPLFLDLKFHDIPNTVAGAIRAVTRLRPVMLTVHTIGGPEMLRAAAAAARNAANAAGIIPPMVIGITVLTSLDDDDLKSMGMTLPVSAQTETLARLAIDCGLDGVVCSPHEIRRLREVLGPEPKIVTPGIRPAGTQNFDQKRIMTPRDAMAAGADFLVIGRPITGAPDPVAAAREIVASIADG